jgi:hypothetical protein
MAVARAVPALTPPLPAVAVAFDVTEVVPMPSLVALALPPAAWMPPAPPPATLVVVTVNAPVKVREAAAAPPAPPKAPVPLAPP